MAVVLPAASGIAQQQASLPLAAALAAATFGVALWSSAQQQGGYLEALPGTAAFALLLGEAPHASSIKVVFIEGLSKQPGPAAFQPKWSRQAGPP